jgi:pyocin large subunit-like protein
LVNSKQYVDHAKNLFNRTEGILSKTRVNGEILRYDIKTNTFGAYTKDGIPKTMFKPTSELDYWIKQG